MANLSNGVNIYMIIYFYFIFFTITIIDYSQKYYTTILTNKIHKNMTKAK